MIECEHVAFLRRLFRGGEICPPICPHCNSENSFPLIVDLERDKYVLRCTKCNKEVISEIQK
jgi:hypothetical protein